MRAIFRREAHEEMIESARYYEARAEGLGSDFLSAVEETTRRIEQSPALGQLRKLLFASALFLDFHLQFSTRYSQIESSLQP